METNFTDVDLAVIRRAVFQYMMRLDRQREEYREPDSGLEAARFAARHVYKKLQNELDNLERQGS